MREFEIQKEFLDSVRDLKPKESTSLEIYEELLFMRFYDVITNSFPIASSLLGEEKLSKLIKLFIQDRPATPFICKTPKEFFYFIKRGSFINSIKVLEILEFELYELKLYLNRKKIKISSFHWKKPLKISSTAILKTLHYKILDNRDLKRERTHYIIYQSPHDFEVYHFDVTPYMFTFLKFLKNNTPLKAFQLTQKQFKTKEMESKKLLQEGIEYLLQNGILN